MTVCSSNINQLFFNFYLIDSLVNSFKGIPICSHSTLTNTLFIFNMSSTALIPSCYTWLWLMFSLIKQLFTFSPSQISSTPLLPRRFGQMFRGSVILLNPRSKIFNVWLLISKSLRYCPLVSDKPQLAKVSFMSDLLCFSELQRCYAPSS